MRLEQLKYLSEVANCKSINKAAHNLYLTQPALSIAITSLEEELQYPLLKRTKRGVTLTEDGEKVLREAQIILDTIQNWYLIKSDKTFNLEGTVHILAIPSICIALSNTLIFRLQERYPKLSVFLHEESPQRIFSTLKNGAINIGILSWPKNKENELFFQAKASQWQIEKLGEDRRWILISTQNPLSEKVLLTQEDLKSLTLAYYSDQTDNISENYRKFFNEKHCFRMNNRESILQMVVDNKAVAIFPDKATKNSYFRKNNLMKAIPAKEIDEEICYFMLHPDEKMVSINELKLMDLMRKYFIPIIDTDDWNFEL